MTVDGSPETGRRDHPERDDRWYLADEREFLLRSLDDGTASRAAGDLSDEDPRGPGGAGLGPLGRGGGGARRLGPRAGGTRTAAARGGPERRPLPLWRRMGIVAACLLIAAGVVILVAHYVQARQPGQSSSGTVSLSQAQLIEQQLEQALVQNNQGNTKAALELYDKVLTEDPSNPAALAYAGYLQWNVGSSAHVASLVRIGRAEIETAVRDSPSYYQGHLFYGLVLENQDHDDAATVTQFDDFLADDPPTAEPAQVADLVAGAYRGAGVPVPSAFSGGTGAGTSAP